MPPAGVTINAVLFNKSLKGCRCFSQQSLSKGTVHLEQITCPSPARVKNEPEPACFRPSAASGDRTCDIFEVRQEHVPLWLNIYFKVSVISLKMYVYINPLVQFLTNQNQSEKP